MAYNNRNKDDVHAPIEDTEVSLGIKLLVLIMFFVLSGVVWGIVAAIVR